MLRMTHFQSTKQTDIICSELFKLKCITINIDFELSLLPSSLNIWAFLDFSPLGIVYLHYPVAVSPCLCLHSPLGSCCQSSMPPTGIRVSPTPCKVSYSTWVNSTWVKVVATYSTTRTSIRDVLISSPSDLSDLGFGFLVITALFQVIQERSRVGIVCLLGSLRKFRSLEKPGVWFYGCI